MAEGKYPQGFTISVYLPKEVTEDQIKQVLDGVFDKVHDVLEDRGEWDPFVVGHKGDLLQIDHEGHDCCQPHIYFSTSCFHGDHDYCNNERGLIGNKTPASCKFCGAPCVCRCHATHEGDSVDRVITTRSASEGEGVRHEGISESG